MRIGIDLGGSKIEVIALAPNGTERLRRRIITPAGDYTATVRAIAELVFGVENELGVQGSVGVGTPGAISPVTGLIKNANSTCLIGHPLHKDLAAALDRPVRLDNDANCFALSEATDGAAAGKALVFGVILGTGVGGGLIVGGRPLTGVNAIAGEWGHNPLPWPAPDELPGRLCYCGKYGCIETFLSGPGLAADGRAATGQDRTPGELVEYAAKGAPIETELLDRYMDRLARALATVVNLVDPEMIVLGGGLSNIGSLYEEVPRRMQNYVFSGELSTKIVPPKHGDSSGVRGAAWLWPAMGEHYP